MYDWISFFIIFKIFYLFDGYELNIIIIMYFFDVYFIKGFLVGNINNGIIFWVFFLKIFYDIKRKIYFVELITGIFVWLVFVYCLKFVCSWGFWFI